MAKDGTPVTVILAKYMISMIEALNMSSIFYPSRFAYGCGDHMGKYECKAEDCHRGPDGRWITNKKTAYDGRSRDPAAYNRFFWRIEPNYCIHGKPCFDAGQIAAIFEKSETKKVIHETGRHSICLEWFKFDLPTETCWGLRQGPVYVSVYEYDKRIWTGNISIEKRGWKKEFSDFIIEHFKWDPNNKE